VYRFYRQLGVSLRHRRPKRNKAAYLRQPKKQSAGINDIWSMDFVAEALFDGRRLRTLPIVDIYASECLAIDVGQSLKGEDLVRVLEQLRMTRGLPKTIKVDSGSEFISKAMDKWAYEHGVELDLSRPGKPTDTRINPWVEMYSYAEDHCLENGMNLLDTVALLIDVKGWSMDDRELDLLRGQIETVIEATDAEVVIVEFAGTDGVAYALASVASDTYCDCTTTNRW
jgi:hypothetical protein